MSTRSLDMETLSKFFLFQCSLVWCLYTLCVLGYAPFLLGIFNLSLFDLSKKGKKNCFSNIANTQNYKKLQKTLLAVNDQFQLLNQSCRVISM